MCCQVDLNRDFPDPFERGSAGIVQPSGREQPETLALMKWIRSRHFVASASLHEARPLPPSLLPSSAALHLINSPHNLAHLHSFPRAVSSTP